MKQQLILLCYLITFYFTVVILLIPCIVILGIVFHRYHKADVTNIRNNANKPVKNITGFDCNRLVFLEMPNINIFLIHI